MNRKLATFMLVLMSIALFGCAQKGESTAGFIEYDSTEFLNANEELSERIPVFTAKYPPNWAHHWVGDSGVIALLIASDDLEAAWKDRDYTSARMLIIPVPYSGQELTEFFYSTLDAHIPHEGTKMEINGQDAAWTEYARNEHFYIEAVIAKKDWAILVFADYPAEKEGEFRALIEATIHTIKVDP